MKKFTPLLAAFGLLVTLATPAHAERIPLTQSDFCGSGDHKPTTDGYQIRDNYWEGTGPACLSTSANGSTAFTVTRVPANGRGRVTTYPDVFTGCAWNVCAPNSTLPVQLSRMKWAVSNWATRENAPGTWDAAYDIWISKHRQTQGHADGAEIMVWLNHHGRCCWIRPGSTTTWIDGYHFLVIHARAYDAQRGHVYWNYVQFRMLSPRWSVHRLFLGGFVRYCITHHLAYPSWWMEDIEAGFEIWDGGVGLATTSFSAAVATR